MRPEVNKGDFVKAGEQAGDAAGRGAGRTFGEGFKKDSQGRLRQANGQFATDAQKAALGYGTKSGENYSQGFNKGSSGLVGSIKKNLGLAAGVFVPVGLAAAVGSIAKIGIAYEDNLNIFKTVSKATGDQMARVAEQARKLGADVTLPGVSAAGAAAAMTELAKAGFTVQQSMDAAKATLQLARIASISEADAAEIAANAVNAFGLKAKDTTFVVDELAAAANSSSIEISDASLAFKQASAVFSGVQGPAVGSKEAITELNTAIAILGNNGIKGSDAGTSLKQALLQLTGPSGVAKSAMKLLALEAAGANVTLTQQSQILHGSVKVRGEATAAVLANNKGIKNTGDIAYDAAGRMRPLRDIIALTTAGTKGMTQEERNYAVTQIFGADASRAIIALMKGGLPIYDKQRQAILQQGAAAQFAAAKNAGLGGAIDNVKSQFENAAIAIYNVAKGPLTSGLNSIAATLPKIFAAVGQFSRFVRDNIGVIRDWAIAITAVTLALKLNALMLSITAAGGLVSYIKSVRLISGVTKGWAAAQAILNATLIANPIGAVIIALVAVGAALVLAYRHSETFRNIVNQAWAAIRVVIGAVFGWITGTVVPALVKAWSAIAAAAMWLWKNAIAPAFKGIAFVIAGWWAAAKVIFGLFTAYLNGYVIPIVKFLYNNVVRPIFAAISKAFQIWWLAARIVFAAFKLYLTNVLFPVIRFLYNNVVRPIFSLLGKLIQVVWTSQVRPAFTAMRIAFSVLGTAIRAVWNTVIRPIFTLFGGYIRNVVAPAFAKGVSAIAAAWNKVKEAARVPVAFVVNHVINPFINGMNNAAKIVGVKGRVSPITGFAAGGLTPEGYATGGKIAGAGGFTDNKQAMVAGLGPVQLMGGEFIVNREDTARSLPLLKWINNGMRGDPTAKSGRASGGTAFKDGGIVGGLKDAWKAITDPVKFLKRPFDALLGRIPGGGSQVKDILVGSTKKLLDGAVGWLKNIAGSAGGGGAGSTGPFPPWPSSPGASRGDSGVWRKILTVIRSTGPVSGSFGNAYRPGDPLWHGSGHAVDWMGYNQDALATFLANRRPLELIHRSGNRDYAYTRGRNKGSFNEALMQAHRNHVHVAMKNGGLLGAGRFALGGQVPGIKVFDKGGAWPSGTLGANLSGRTEYVDPNTGGARGDTYVFERGAFEGMIVADSRGFEDMVFGAIKSGKRRNRKT